MPKYGKNKRGMQIIPMRQMPLKNELKPTTVDLNFGGNYCNQLLRMNKPQIAVVV